MNQQPTEALRERWAAKVANLGGEGCWLWTGWKGGPDGSKYGYISVGGRAGRGCRAHRVSWELHHGPIPEGMHVLHKCDVPLCVNPEHLFLGTRSDNMQDMISKGRDKSVTHPELVRKGEAHHNARLTLPHVSNIRMLLALGARRSAVAEWFGVSHSLVEKIGQGRLWAA